MMTLSTRHHAYRVNFAIVPYLSDRTINHLVAAQFASHSSRCASANLG